MNDLYRKMMSSYKLTTDRDVRTARYKAGQEIILSGLYHGGFFDTAAFCGGSCLRVFHGLERFSEDMDFCLMESDDGFDFSKFVKHIMDEFALVGREVEVKEKACRGRQ
ncbi:MAG: nucleotidyl transferase AbiEii/AbiGii toxin family protein, partial [Marinilabiliaceae bacterium]